MNIIKLIPMTPLCPRPKGLASTKMAEGYQHPRPPLPPPPGLPPGPPPSGPPPPGPPPLPAAVRPPGFPPPLGRAPPPPPPPFKNLPPPLTNPPPPPPPLPNPAETTRATEPETIAAQKKKADQSDHRRSDVTSHDTSTRTTKHDAPQTVTVSSKKEEEQKFEPLGSKVKMSFGGRSGSVLGKRPAAAGAITMKLKPQVEAGSTNKKLKTELPSVKKTSPNLVAQAFGSDSEEEEEMPPEAKLRMRNIGKDTPTSAGPNSFNKSAKGFSDPRGSWRNEVDEY